MVIARSVERTDLAKCKALEWVTVVFHFKHTDANQARAALNNFVTRNGGCITPVSTGSNAIIVSDYAECVKALAAVIEKLDMPSAIKKEEPQKSEEKR